VSVLAVHVVLPLGFRVGTAAHVVHVAPLLVRCFALLLVSLPLFILFLHLLLVLLSPPPTSFLPLLSPLPPLFPPELLLCPPVGLAPAAAILPPRLRG